MRIALQNEFQRLINEPFQHILSEPGVRLLTKLDRTKEIDFVPVAVVNEYLRSVISSNVESELTERNAIIQFTNNNLVHYGYLKILYEQGKKPSCLFVDASTPEEHFYGFIRKLRHHFANVYTVIGCELISKIQIDTKSCALFSYYHASLFAHNLELTREFVKRCKKAPASQVEFQRMLVQSGLSSENAINVEKKVTLNNDDEAKFVGDLHVVTWKELPPEVIQHIQSLTSARHYCDYQSDKNNMFVIQMKTFLNKQIAVGEMNGEKKERNYGILYFCREVSERVGMYLTVVHDDILLHHLFPERELRAEAINEFFRRGKTPEELFVQFEELTDILRSDKKSRVFSPLSSTPVKATFARSASMNIGSESSLGSSSSRQRKLSKSPMTPSMPAVSLSRSCDSGVTYDDMFELNLFIESAPLAAQDGRTSPVVVNLAAVAGLLKPSPKRSPKKDLTNETSVVANDAVIPPPLAFG